MYTHIITNNDQHQFTPRSERLYYPYKLQQKDDVIKEHFNDLQTKLQEFDVVHQPSIDLYRTITPSSRDSGIPIPSSSSSCSPTFEKVNTPKNSLDPLQSQHFEFFLHPPINNPYHISIHPNESTIPMSHIYDTTSRYRSHGRSVHWNDEPVLSSRDYDNSTFTNIQKHGQRISLNTSLPFHSKLNIRIQAKRTYSDDSNETNQIKTTATIQRLNSQNEYEHNQALQRAYFKHYSTLSPNENIRRNSPIQYDKLPRHRQISLPVSLPINQRLFLYIHNGEVLARC